MGYWDGAVQGARVGQQIGDNLTTGALQDQALRQENAARDQVYQSNALKLSQASLANQDVLATRADMANAQATPAATPTAPLVSMAPQAAPAIPVSSAAQLMGIAAPTQQQLDITGLQANVDKYPGMVALSGSDKRLAEMKAAVVQAGAQSDPAATVAAPVDTAPSPAVTAPAAAVTAPVTQPTATGVDGHVTPTDRIKAAIDGALARGDNATAETLKQQAFANAKAVVDATGNPNEGLKIINAATGNNFSYQKVANNEFLKDGEGNIVAAVNVTGLNMDVTNGMPYSQALTKNSTPTAFGAGKSSLITGYLADHASDPPMDQVKGLYQVATENGISTKMLEPVLTNLVKQATEQDANTRQAAAFEHTDQVLASTQAHSDKLQANSQAHTDRILAQKTASSGGLTDQAVNDAAQMYNISGTLPSGRNKEANAAIQNRAAELRQASGQSAAGVIANAGDMKALQGTIAQQEKQVGSMGSFVKNISKQVSRFEEISAELKTADARLLNVPLRAMRGMVAGSPLQAKVDMYITEISSETGKLATGASGSVAELSQGAREKWEKIHDPNLSMSDLLSVLKETRHAGSMRMNSVNEQLTETRAKRASIGAPQVAPAGTRASHNGKIIISDGKGGWN